MRKLFVVFVILSSLTLSLFGQELTLTKKYAGMLYAGQYNEDLKVSHSTSIRIAGEMKMILSNSTNLFLRGVYSSDNSNLGQFWFEEHGMFTLRFGYMARPIAFLNRPMPISAGAHFEPPALAAIPGSSFGALALKEFDGFSVYGGVYTKGLDPEANAGFKFMFLGTEIKAGGFMNLNTSDKGIAGGFQNPVGQVVVYYTGSRTTSLFYSVNLEGVIEPYITIVSKDRNSSSEVGFTKTIKVSNEYTNNLYGLLGLGYHIENKALMFYIWMYVD